MERIRSVEAQVEPLGEDSTVSVTVTTERGFTASATLPAGISVGTGEATLVEPKTAVETIRSTVAPALIGQDCLEQRALDELLMDLDATADRSRLGANALLPVSLASCRVGAKALKRELYEHIAELANTPPKLPELVSVVLEGGKHAPEASGFTLQEVSLIGSPERLAELLDALETELSRHRLDTTTAGEGGCAPKLSGNDQGLLLLERVMKRLDWIDPRLALDVAASHGLVKLQEVETLLKRFPIAIVEDPIEESNVTGWISFTKQYGAKLTVAADDLTVGNPTLIKDAVKDQVANALVLKLNQTATLSELFDLADLVRVGNWQVMVSHRGHEVEDDFIVDLAVGIGANYLKMGTPRSPVRRPKFDRYTALRTQLTASRT